MLLYANYHSICLVEMFYAFKDIHSSIDVKVLLCKHSVQYSFLVVN